MTLGRIKGTVLLDRGGARSGEVRVSYFDPATGEPREAPKANPRARIKNAWGARGPRRAVLVDGVRHPSIRAAAVTVGATEQHLALVLRKGINAIKGHSVEYAEVKR